MGMTLKDLCYGDMDVWSYDTALDMAKNCLVIGRTLKGPCSAVYDMIYCPYFSCCNNVGNNWSCSDYYEVYLDSYNNCNHRKGIDFDGCYHTYNHFFVSNTTLL